MAGPDRPLKQTEFGDSPKLTFIANELMDIMSVVGIVDDIREIFAIITKIESKYQTRVIYYPALSIYDFPGFEMNFDLSSIGEVISIEGNQINGPRLVCFIPSQDMYFAREGQEGKELFVEAGSIVLPRVMENTEAEIDTIIKSMFSQLGLGDGE